MHKCTEWMNGIWEVHDGKQSNVEYILALKSQYLDLNSHLLIIEWYDHGPVTNPPLNIV